MSERQLCGKVAVVTGAASGIGRSTAQLLAARGAYVYLVDMDSRAEKVVSDIRDGGGEAEGYLVDVSNIAEVRQMIKTVGERWGKIDILVNNAGIRGGGTIEKISEEDWDRVMAINVKSMFLCSQAAFSYLKAAPKPSIVNTASIAGYRGHPFSGAYGPSKGAVIAFTRELAMEWAQYGIRVNAVAPGLIETGMTKEKYANPQLTKARSEFVPLGRIGQPEDIAKAILFLASSDADYITAQVLTVDGGMLENTMLKLNQIGSQILHDTP